LSNPLLYDGAQSEIMTMEYEAASNGAPACGRLTAFAPRHVPAFEGRHSRSAIVSTIKPRPKPAASRRSKAKVADFTRLSGLVRVSPA